MLSYIKMKFEQYLDYLSFKILNLAAMAGISFTAIFDFFKENEAAVAALIFIILNAIVFTIKAVHSYRIKQAKHLAEMERERLEFEAEMEQKRIQFEKEIDYTDKIHQIEILRMGREVDKDDKSNDDKGEVDKDKNGKNEV